MKSNIKFEPSTVSKDIIISDLNTETNQYELVGSFELYDSRFEVRFENLDWVFSEEDLIMILEYMKDLNS